MCVDADRPVVEKRIFSQIFTCFLKSCSRKKVMRSGNQEPVRCANAVPESHGQTNEGFDRGICLRQQRKLTRHFD